MLPAFFDSSGRRFLIPPETHDILMVDTIEPGERKILLSWQLDECTRDEWGCCESRVLPPGTYTIKGRLRPKPGRAWARLETTFRIVAA